MTVIDKTEPSQTNTISFELDLPHPPEKVWRALTEPALLEEWLLPTLDFSLAKGAAFQLKSQPYPGWNGIVDCRFVEIEAERVLRYTWGVSDMGLDTVVTFRLAPTAAGTLLSIEQSGFKPEQAKNFGGARYGWKSMGGKLVGVLGKTS